MFSSQQARVARASIIIAIIGSLAACSDVSNPALMHADDAASKVVSADQVPGLVAAYNFDESGSSISDASSSGNNGSFASGVSRSSNGKFGSALSFDGSGFATIPSAASLQLTSAMTLEAWVNPSTVSSAWRSVIYKGDDNYYLMGTSSQSGRPAGGASFGNTSSTTEAYGTSTLAVNTWSHLAVTYDGSTVRLYVNGTQVGTKSKRGTFAKSSNALQIGGNSNYGQYFRGSIDEVRVYNRALSASEIQGDMNTAVAKTTTSSSDGQSGPALNIAAPTTDATFSTTDASAVFSGTASASAGVKVVGWTNDRGGSGVASGTTNWSTAAIPLQSGNNVITIGVQDNSDAITTKAVTVVRGVVVQTQATQLGVTRQPSMSAASGAAFAQQPVVQLRDANGNAYAQSGITVVASIGSGGGTLAGTTSATTNASGAATFSNLSIAGAIGARVLNFTAGQLTPTISGNINISAGATSKLVLSNIATQAANTAFNVTISLQDAWGNPASNTGSTGTITLSRASGTGTLGGNTSGTISAGSTSLSINGVTYSKGESGVVITATGSGAGSVSGQSGSSNAFTVTGTEQDAPPAGGGNSYTTAFPNSEQPISEGGRWINGGTNGIDWTDVWSLGGKAIGRESGPTYTDGTALLTGTWGADQQATATVFNSSAVSGDCYPEVELRLRSAIAPHSIRGYEIGFKLSQAADAYLIIVRWNGPVGNFTYLLNAHGAQYGVKNGDVVSAKVVGNTITAYKNGVVMGTATDNTYTNGSPGMGFNLENDMASCRGLNDRYGYSRFTAVDGAK